MSTHTEHINLINKKLQHLLKKYELLQTETARQKQTIEKLQQQEETLKTKLDTLQEQHLILRASAAPLNDADKKDLEQKINIYLRNIDKCISLLAQ
ncbi:MAG: hypothetical protein ABI091_01810 [Ferruginibacter sp.]